MARILLAEDDTSMRAFLRGALERAGHAVTAAEDGLEALSLLKQTGTETFDLLLADIVMPGLDGIQLAQEASHLHPDLKVMFITGFAAVAMGQRNPDHGNARVLSKPFHLSELVAQVEHTLSEQNAEQEG